MVGNIKVLEEVAQLCTAGVSQCKVSIKGHLFSGGRAARPPSSFDLFLPQFNHEIIYLKHFSETGHDIFISRYIPCKCAVHVIFCSWKKTNYS